MDDRAHHVEPEWRDKSGEVNDIDVKYKDELIKKGFFPEDRPKVKPLNKNVPIIIYAFTLDRKALVQQFEDTKHRMVNYKFWLLADTKTILTG